MIIFQRSPEKNDIKVILPAFVGCWHYKYVTKGESRIAFKDMPLKIKMRWFIDRVVNPGLIHSTENLKFP